MANIDYDIEEIRYFKYLVFQKLNVAFSRVIFQCVRADEKDNSAFHIVYNAIFKVNHHNQVEFRLVYNKTAKCWYLEELIEDSSRYSYKLVLATNNLPAVLQINDIITFYDKEIDSYYRFKVIKYFDKYKRYIVEDTTTKKRFNLSTPLKIYSKLDVSISTYDSNFNKEAS